MNVYVIPMDGQLDALKEAPTIEEVLRIAKTALELAPGKPAFLSEPKPIKEMKAKEIRLFERNLRALGHEFGPAIGIVMFNHIPFDLRLRQLGYSEERILNSFYRPLFKQETITALYFGLDYRSRGNESIAHKYTEAEKLGLSVRVLPAGNMKTYLQKMLLKLKGERSDLSRLSA